MKLIGTILLFAGSVAVASAQYPAPEIDSNSAITALALLSGTLLMLGSRRKK